VLVAVAAKGAKTGLMLYEVKRAAAEVAAALRIEEAPDHGAAQPAPEPASAPAHDALSSLPSLDTDALVAEPTWTVTGNGSAGNGAASFGSAWS
jgi:homospermidine synthase